MPSKTIGGFSAPHCYYKTWSYTNSNRDVSGKLILASHPTYKEERICGPYNAERGEPGLVALTSRLDTVLDGTTARAKYAYAAAYDKFREKAWNDAQASILVDFAERRQTLNMLAGTLSRILRAGRQARVGRMTDAARTLGLDKVPRGVRKSDTFEVFKNNWLAYRYGWLPLMKSAESLLDVLVTPLPDFYYVRASGNAPIERDIVVANDLWTKHILAYRKTRCVIKGRVRITNPDQAALNQYGLLNVGMAAWEIIPYSFVIDWFTNIGNAIEDLTSFAGMTIDDVTITYHESVYQYLEQKRAGGLNLDGVYYPKAGYTNYGYGVSKRRSLANGLHRPSRAFFHNGLNKKRCLDAVALAGNFFNGKEPPEKQPKPKRKPGTRWVQAKNLHKLS